MKITQREESITLTERAKTKKREDLRCVCGNLMALMRKEGIELKCRRCKRKSIIPLNAISGNGVQRWPELPRSI